MKSLDKGTPRWTRRRFVAVAGALMAPSGSLLFGAAQAPSDEWATPFDRAMGRFMEERKIPGGALAVVRDRRLVHARGYGWADPTRNLSVKPDSLFRLASVSKPITAVAVLKLVEEGRLSLEAAPFELLALDELRRKGGKFDDRWRRLTVRQLLHHTAGWDRDRNFDPMFRLIDIARELGVPRPAGPMDVIRFMLRHPLDFDPGARYAYSNFGYCVLGRVIEKITEQPYETFVRASILAPLGIQRMKIGASLDGRQAEGETRYFTADNATTTNVFRDGPARVPWPYGGFHLEAMDAHGGWIGSAVDLTRWAAALDDPEHSPLRKPETIHVMYEAPAAPVSRKADGALKNSWYGCGWMVRPTTRGKANYWHSGSLPGTSTLLVRRSDGISFAALFNQRSDKDDAIDAMLNRAAKEVKEWPTEDAARETL